MQLGVEVQTLGFRERFLRGEIDYTEWCKLDALLWTGQEVKKIEGLLRKIPYLPNAKKTIAKLKRKGIRLFLISNGINLHVEQVREELGFEYAISNDLISHNGILTGEVKVNVPFDGKGRIVDKILTNEGIDPECSAAVGNDESDIPMFGIVGIGIAINPTSDRVRQSADVGIEETDLYEILPYILSRG